MGASPWCMTQVDYTRLGDFTTLHFHHKKCTGSRFRPHAVASNARVTT
jgi:hypothetical protein